MAPADAIERLSQLPPSEFTAARNAAAAHLKAPADQAVVRARQKPTTPAWAVNQHGLRLLPELYAHLNPMPFEAAVQMEMDLAEDLRRAGYTVTGGH